MKRVLVTGATNIGKAGVATIVYKWGQQFDSNKIVYNYLMQRRLPDECYQKAIKIKGGEMYTLEEQKNKIFSIIKWIERIVRNNDYKIIHINSDSAYIAAAYIYASKKGGIKNIYVHSHCTQIDDNSKLMRMIKTILHKLCVPYVRNNSRLYLACSELAGEWMFGKIGVKSSKYKTIFNGVEPEKYKFNRCNRELIREKFAISDKVVLGNIGRFSYQKNHDLLIDIFEDYLKKNSNSVLMLIGCGELEATIKAKVEKKQLTNKVMFLGLRDDIPEILSAMDVLVMPSRFEGLPITLVEAQMASLPCVVSKNITREAKFVREVVYVSNDDLKEWSKKIEEMLKIDRSKLIIPPNSKFDIKNATLELQEILER